MKNRFQLVVAVAVLVVHAVPIVARADAGFGFRRDLNFRVRFENLDDYPAYDFYLKFSLGAGTPYASPHLTKVNSGRPTQLQGQGNRLTEVYLLAVPHGQEVGRPPTVADGGKWLSDIPSGGLQSDSLPGDKAQTELTGEFDGFTCSYRVRIEGNNLAVTWVGAEAPPSEALTWLAWGCTGVAGLALSAALAVGVLVWLLRSRRAVQP